MADIQCKQFKRYNQQWSNLAGTHATKQFNWQSNNFADTQPASKTVADTHMTQNQTIADTQPSNVAVIQSINIASII